MCSNSSPSNSGGGSGDYDGYGGGDGLFSKKRKREKVPKRGPGVAELEKILMEQEIRSDLSLVSPISVPNSLPANSKNFTTLAQAQPLGGGGDNSRKVGGMGMYLPEEDLLPTMWNWNTYGNNVDGKFVSKFQFANLPFNGSANQLLPSSSNFIQSTPQHPPPTTKNMFSNSTALSYLTTLPAENCQGREPPSIQTYYRHSSLWHEETKVGEKRERGVVVGMEIPPVPNFRYQNPTLSAQMNRLDTPFSYDSYTPLLDFQPIHHSISREPNSKRSHRDNGESSVLMFPSPTTHTPNLFNPFPLQESNGDIHQMPNTQVGGSIRKKPFYSFLQPIQKKSFNTERAETQGDGIDLELRL